MGEWRGDGIKSHRKEGEVHPICCTKKTIPVRRMGRTTIEGKVSQLEEEQTTKQRYA